MRLINFIYPDSRPWLAVLTLLLSLIALPALAKVEVKASVDRYQLTLNDTFTLSLTADSMGFSDRPDMRPLEQDFQILNQQQSSRSSFINGAVTAERRWDFTLAPKRAGTLTIPAIQMGKYQTRPITVTVSDSPRQTPDSSEDVFLETELSPKRSYVQAQVDFTVRLYTAVNFLDASLEPLNIAGALVEPAGEERYQTSHNGRYYQVIERRYHIYPQRSGTLDIPSLTLEARLENLRRSLLDPGRQLIKRTSPKTLTVLPPAQDFSGATWLPARELAISDSWSADPDTVQVGDSITRTVTVSANGLLGAQLPDLPEVTLSNARLYPDQAKIENPDQGNWTGERSESVAIIPTQPGSYHFPELRIPWWNTDTDRQEYALLPARTLTVVAAPGQQATTAPSANPNPAPTGTANIAGQQSHASTSPSDRSATDSSAPLPEASNPDAPRSGDIPREGLAVWGLDGSGSRLIAALFALLLLGNICFAGLWWRARRRLRTDKPTTMEAADQTSGEKAAFKALRRAVAQGHPQDIRAQLLQWAALGHPDPGVRSLADIGHSCPEMTDYCRQLDDLLYAANADHTALDRQGLETALRHCRRLWQNGHRKQTSAALKPLYPN